MRAPLAGRGILVVPFAVASVLILSGLFIGFAPVSGKYDSESFSCGSPFSVAVDDGGYGGTEQYKACERERSHMRVVALGSLFLGIVLLAAPPASMRRPSDDRQAEVSS